MYITNKSLGITLLIFLEVMATVFCGCNQSDSDIEYLENGAKRITRHGENGYDTVEVFYKNGKIASQYIEKENKYSGIYKAYFENGDLYINGNYLNGKRNGLFETYSKGGFLKQTEIFKEDSLLYLSFHSSDGKVYHIQTMKLDTINFDGLSDSIVEIYRNSTLKRIR